jgi:hypothetical protein
MQTMLLRRVLCGVAAALALGANAFAQQGVAANPIPPTFGLLSLVGDQFTVVFRRDEIGSRTDQNFRRDYPIDGATLDDIALGAAESVVKRLKPVSPVVRFSIRDARLFALQDKLLVDSTESRGMREALGNLLREHQVRRLVLVTKWRDDAQFQLHTRTIGSGKISGLGFYVDSVRRLYTLETGEATFGFLGPYAYLSVAVVDAASLTPIRSVPARESLMRLPLHETGAVHAWDALTPTGKVDALEQVLRQAVENATTAALAE